MTPRMVHVLFLIHQGLQWSAIKYSPWYSSMIRILRKVMSSVYISTFNSLNLFSRLIPSLTTRKGVIRRAHTSAALFAYLRDLVKTALPACSGELGNHFSIGAVKYPIQVQPSVSLLWWRISVECQSHRKIFFSVFRFYVYLVPSYVFLS